MSEPQLGTVEYWAATTPATRAFVEGGRRLTSAAHIVAEATNLSERAEIARHLRLPLEPVERYQAAFASCVQ
ncbi:hypothetical protein UP06_15800 [Bradyrhizobium sp. LTSP857]|nr:hypothetical protein UP06_15800 [Bradyrhizobium sp. LTSP857]